MIPSESAVRYSTGLWELISTRYPAEPEPSEGARRIGGFAVEGSVGDALLGWEALSDETAHKASDGGALLGNEVRAHVLTHILA